MATKEEILKKATDAVLNQDKEETIVAVNEALDAGIDPLEIVKKGLSRAMEKIQKNYDEGKMLLPHLVMASEAMIAGINELKPEIEKRNEKLEKSPTVLIGTVEGDIHSIGKNVVTTMLRISGFEVIDLGVDVSIEDFLDNAEKHGVDIIATSALMTTSMPGQRLLEERLREEGIREKYKTMVGGAPVSQEWANKIGADVYAENATEAANKLRSLKN